MSLNVPKGILDRAEVGTVTDAEFISVIKDSLPGAWEVIHNLVHCAMGNLLEEFKQKYRFEVGANVSATITLSTLTESVQAELLRMMASTSMRTAVFKSYSGSECLAMQSLAGFGYREGVIGIFSERSETCFPSTGAWTKFCCAPEDMDPQTYLNERYPLALAVILNEEEWTHLDCGSVVINPDTLDDDTREQYLMMLACEVAREAFTRYMSAKMGVAGLSTTFVNCHRLVLTPPTAKGTKTMEDVRSPAFQLLAQIPSRQHC